MFPQDYLDQRQEPFNQHYLQRLGDVLQSAQDEYPRSLAIRIDLRMSPEWITEDSVCCNPNMSRDLLSRFISSLRAKIAHYRHRLKRSDKRAHPCRLRYFWVREIDTAVYPHYHVVLFLNKDLFRGLGSADNPQSLWVMIQSAWMSALDLRDYDDYRSLVEFPDNPVYVLETNASDYSVHYKRLVFRLSYLAKERTKAYSSRERSMGCSQY
ncbi:inovirus Gp2 family protein [Kluyvera ascorbata]|uniref:inovirus Gp2 family protein n=1 Tax=Kluyvera ascorbata TaxID=51288 RepID=UPI00206DC87D|nr:inovirus Gp2 family protein [Kluyvera ascorbata]UPQ70154.1 inovirus Gp2 family protein [Kluyvera ascorbata]